MGVDQYHRVRDREEFQLVGVPVKPGGSADLVKTDNGSLASMEVKATVREWETRVMKRKRGRPPKGQTRTTRPVEKKKVEEDVCFICFDGGNLVLCDRRECPKAYHPSCIKRDQSFFRSRAKWNCGWHICSNCQKAAHYMCYTCTYSLCKGCTKGADYVSVRGNFGFCGTCMRTIMLIENSVLGNKEECDVDFDDKTSWEYLFKVYWVYLKSKLSLTLDELDRGQSPWKGDLIMGSTDETYSILNHGRHEKCSLWGSSGADIETNDSRRRKIIDHWNSVNKEDSTCIEKLGIDKKMRLPESGNWESKELIETNDLKTRNTIDHQNSFSEEESRYVEKLGFDKKMPLPESTNWESKDILKTNDSKRRKTMEHRNSFVKEDSTYIEKLGVDKNMYLPESTNWASKELLEFVGHVKNGDISVLSQYDVQTLLWEYIEKNNLCDPCQKCEVLCDARLKILFGRARVSEIEVPKLLKSHFLNEGYTHGEINISLRSLDTAADQGETNGLSDRKLMLDIDKKHGPCKVIDIQVLQNDLNAFEAIDSHNIKLIYLCRKQIENLVEDADMFHRKVVGSMVRIKIPNGDQMADKYRLVLVVGTREVAQQYKVSVRTTDVMLEIINFNKKEVISIDGISNQEFSEDECRRFRRSIKTGLSKFLKVCDIQEKAMILQAIRVNNLKGAETLQLNHLRDRPSAKGYKKEPLECAKKLQLSNSEDEQQQLHEIPAVHSDHKIDQSYEFDDNEAGELKEKMTDDNFRSKSSGPNREERGYLSPRCKGYNLNDVGTRVNATSAARYDQVGRKSSLETGTILAAQGTRNSGYIVETSNLSFSPVASETLTTRILHGAKQSMNDFEADNVWHYNDQTGKTQGPFSMFQLRKGNASRHFPLDLRIWRTDEKKDCSVLLTEALNGKYQESMLSATVSTGGDNGCNSERISNIDKASIEGSKKSKLKNRRPHHKRNDESVRINEWNCHSSSQAANADLAKYDASNDGKIQDCQSVPSTTFIERLRGTTSDRRMEGSRMNANSDKNDSNRNMIKARQCHSEQGFQQQLDIDGQSGLSSEHNRRAPPVSSFSSCPDFSNFPTITPVNSSSDCWGSKCTFDSKSKTLQPNEKIDFFELQSPNPTPNNVWKIQACQYKQSPSSWSTASSLVSDPASHPEAVECKKYSSMPTQPSVEEWDSSFVRPKEITTDHGLAPSLISCQHPQSSPSKLAYNESNWQVVINDSNDFSFDESVSDLLAKVEAMESRGGVDSPTSIMNDREEFTDASKNDCLSSAEGIGPLPDLGKVDALSSTADAQLTPYSTFTENLHVGHQADMLQCQRMTSAQSGVGAKKTDSFFQPKEASANIPVSVPSTTTWEVATMDIPWRLGSDFTSTLWGAAQENANLGWSSLAEGNSNMTWGAVEFAMQENVGRISSWTTIGNPGIWGSQPRNGSDRISSSKDQNFHGRDYVSDWGRNN